MPSQNLHPLVRIRTVTAFIKLPRDPQQWQQVLAQAKRQCDRLADALEQHAGYAVQSIRLVSNPFGEYLDTRSIDSAQQGLACITALLSRINTGTRRIRFAIGEARSSEEIALLPELIASHGDLCNACVNVELDANGYLADELLQASVQAVQQIALCTPRGEGNFNFTVNFNCASGIPYFPAGYHRGELDQQLVLGLETPDLLVDVLQALQPERESLAHAAWMARAAQVMGDALNAHTRRVSDCVAVTTLDEGWRVIGMDTSAAPSKSCASMVQVYQLLGVPFFGASGTVEASALLTRVFKSVQHMPQIGFSGLMLAVTEDSGLAQATQDGQFDIRALLTYSSVCGIGLDTVPVPGDASADQIAAVMRDTGTMAFRLKKPLTVRLFPVPGLKAGDITAFESTDLCNCAVLDLP
ncbi:MAG: DUF711 family protein [Comamonas sp.]|jgi:uncharacterized protein (UPF0210 family)|uniref:DUF711 family protein n=1 Tax=Comamonas sp. TaxID=34028 RepID=UPI00281EEBAB|nr:DUF711 family protein [Comamonas sp.]MDR0212671.1 DUF711 family protein [Comamonas sp.]